VRQSFDGLREAIIEGGVGHFEITPRLDSGDGTVSGAGAPPSFVGWQEIRSAVESRPHVRAAGATLQFAGVVTNGERSAAFFGVAVETEREPRLGMRVRVRRGSNLAATPPADGDDRALLGVGLARDLAAEPGDVVVNCTGLGARELASDHELEALLGQVVITEPGAADLALAVSDDRDPDRLFYVIPRRDELVLGGCSVPLAPGVEADCDDAITDRILAQAKRLGIAAGAVRRVRVGLRPYRAAVRLERDGRIVHNYGHGGAGFTLCRGCAEDVAALLA